MTATRSTTEPVVYVNGAYLRASEAKVSVFDHGILYGDGVYDTMCAWKGRVFKLDRHIDRLYESAHAIKLNVPATKDQIKEVVLQTVRCNELTDAYVKVVVTRGISSRPLLNPRGCVPNLIVFAVPYMSQAEEGGDDTGIKMIVSSLRRIPNQCISAKIKSCNYLNHVLMRVEANELGADDAIELDLEGYVCEAPGYNVFCVKHGVLMTAADNILVGITRETVLELANSAGLPVSIGRVQTFDLYNADEVFLSSTAGGIVPVVQLDGRQIANGKPGAVTTTMKKWYWGLLESGEMSVAVYANSAVGNDCA